MPYQIPRSSYTTLLIAININNVLCSYAPKRVMILSACYGYPISIILHNEGADLHGGRGLNGWHFLMVLLPFMIAQLAPSYIHKQR